MELCAPATVPPGRRQGKAGREKATAWLDPSPWLTSEVNTRLVCVTGWVGAKLEWRIDYRFYIVSWRAGQHEDETN